VTKDRNVPCPKIMPYWLRLLFIREEISKDIMPRTKSQALVHLSLEWWK